MKIVDLKAALKGVSKGHVLIPILSTYLNDPKFSKFSIEVSGYDEVRKVSGYFHPSTHCTWTVRQLALYRMAPELVRREPLPYTGTLSVTQGNFWHGFVAHILTSQGIMVDSEVRFVDELYQRSGYADGIIMVNGEKEIFELKTINAASGSKLVTVEDVKREKYKYWCQVQEYLDVFDLKRGRILFITPDYPFPMREFLIERDDSFLQEQRDKYTQAIEIADNSKLPLSKNALECCGKPQHCPVERICDG